MIVRGPTQAARPPAIAALGRIHAEPARVLAGPDITREVVRRVTTRILGRTEQEGGTALDEIISETIGSERARLVHDASAPSAAADDRFIIWLRRQLAYASDARCRELLYAIVDHYIREIEGYFDQRMYVVATRVVPPVLNALLTGYHSGPASERDIDDRVLVEGEVETLRRLVGLGTVVLAPTHVSNLDSLVLGSAICRMGLPPFAYGAGLNLFSNAPITFFMRNLGAYTVDRKKTDPVYIETLKEYEAQLIERGQHTLFFPGATRSRSGAVESHLKKGLLGTAPVALRRALAAGSSRARVFIVPCTLSYPLVLEAPTLVADDLKNEGGPGFVDMRDPVDRPRAWIQFIRGLLKLDARVHVRIGRPIDIVGHEVAPDGTSHDATGRIVDPARYLLVDGQLGEDDTRDAAYTRYVAAAVLAAYRRDTVALPTSAVAFTVFRHLRRGSSSPSLSRFLRRLDPSVPLPRQPILEDLGLLLAELRILESRGALQRSPDLRGAAPQTVLTRALATFATYHPARVIEERGENLHVGDAALLHYYRNRLEGYGLLEALSDGPSVHNRPRTSEAS